MANAVFPNGIKQWIDKKDFIDDVEAKHINEAYAEIIAVETELLGATYNATPNKYIKRDSAGRAKVGKPLASDDIARKAEVDELSESFDAKFQAFPSDEIQGSSYARIETGVGVDYVKHKEIQVFVSGTVKVRVGAIAKTIGTSDKVYLGFFKNGLEQDSFLVSHTDFSYYVTQIVVEKGDFLQVYVKKDTSVNTFDKVTLAEFTVGYSLQLVHKKPVATGGSSGL